MPRAKVRRSKAGRPSLPGPRGKNGRRKQATPTVGVVPPSCFTAAKRERYGQDGADAIGRAYRTGLLGHGNQAKERLDTARAMFATYWQHLPLPGIACALGDKTGGSSGPDPERAHRREQRMREALASVEALSRHHRRAFDQLVIDVQPDYGPPWLDRLINRAPLDTDRAMLKLAIEALDAC